jgi:integrase/recombinase XerD
MPHLVLAAALAMAGSGPQRRSMTHSNELIPVPSNRPAPLADQLRLAVVAYLARFTDSSRDHADSDLRYYLNWCAERGLDPLTARRPYLELNIRWMQEACRFKPSTVSRRFSVTAGFYRTCVIDGVLDQSPAEHVRRPALPPESPTLGFTHLQFEALLTAARESAHRCDFALVAMFGLLGLRIFEATGADIADLGEEHGHRVLRVCGKGGKVVLIPLPPAVGRAIDRAVAGRASGPILRNRRGARMNRHAATRRLRRLAEQAGCQSAGRTRTCSGTPSSPPCSMLGWTCGTCRSPPGTPTPAPRCAITGPATTSTGTRTTSWPPTWPPAPERGRKAARDQPSARELAE